MKYISRYNRIDTPYLGPSHDIPYIPPLNVPLRSLPYVAPLTTPYYTPLFNNLSVNNRRYVSSYIPPGVLGLPFSC